MACVVSTRLSTPLRILAVGFGLLALLLTALLMLANTDEGQRLIERSVASLTDRQVRLTGLSGQLPLQIRLDLVELQDDKGSWLTIKRPYLDWHLPSLLTGRIRLDRLGAEQIVINRLPPPSNEPSPPPPSLPLAVTVAKLAVERIDLSPAVAGVPVSLSLRGSASLAALDRIKTDLVAQRLDSNDQYRIAGAVSVDGVDMQAVIQESSRGLLAQLAGLQQAYPINLDARLQGPLSAVATHFQLTFGPLQAAVQGLLDIDGPHSELTISAQSSAMQLLPDCSWQSLDLTAQVSGNISRLTIDGNGKLTLQRLNLAGTEIGRIELNFTGQNEHIQLAGHIKGIKSPQLASDLLQNRPLELSADFSPALAGKPLAFQLRHPALQVTGKAALDQQANARASVAITQLQPWTKLAGLDVQGRAEFKLNGAQRGQGIELDTTGTLSLTAGDPLLRGLLGKQTAIALTAKLDDTGSELTKLDLQGGNLTLNAQGDVTPAQLAGEYRVSIRDLAAINKDLTGKLSLSGKVTGAPEDFSLTSDLSGAFNYQANGRRASPKPINAKLRLDHLPKSPTGRFDGKLSLAESPLTWLVAANSSTSGLQIDIDRATWKSAQLGGKLNLPASVGFLIGKIQFKMPKLADLQDLLGQPLTGSIDGVIATALNKGKATAQLQMNTSLGLADNLAVQQASLALTATDLLGQPRLDGGLEATGITSDAIKGGLQLSTSGLLSALDLNLTARLTDQTGNPIKLTIAALANAPAQQLEITQLQSDWRQQTLALLEPLQIDMTNGIAVNRLRLAINQAVLSAAGRISPELDLTAKLERLPADLLALINPELSADGSISADARLTGTGDKPTGSITIQSTDINLRNKQFMLPPIRLTAKALFDGSNTDLSGRIKAGNDSRIAINGRIPFLADDELALHTDADINLKLTNPMLNAAGRRLRGQAKLTAGLTGTLAQPRYTGGLQLINTEFRDYALGVNITGINASIQADNGLIRINQIKARAGQGQILSHGTVAMTASGMPVDLSVTAQDAQLLASDHLSVNLNSDLHLKGEAQDKLMVLGSVLINRAEVRIPERMPETISVLKIQSAEAEKAPPPAPQNTRLGLNLVITAPANIFVRGHGLNAELYGSVRLTGQAQQPHPDGVFKLRRGDFNLAGKVLNFSEGSVSFDGGSLTNPSLYFVASSLSDNIKAVLTVSGTASNPKISLSSVPSLPQDEILARLLFNQSTANLSVTEMVQIGSALASLTGSGSGLGDPLEDVRKTLGLDRLSVGSSLEAGRYIAPGVYLGAKQSLAGNSPQATIQIDLTKRLKLEATAGAASTAANSSTPNTNTVGIIYQYEY